MNSKRLPRKVLFPLEDKTVLGHIVYRLQHCSNLDDIVVATSTEFLDDEIINWCKQNNVNFFRGSLNDVLDRYYNASKYYCADAIVRITADCPVIDPEIVDEVIMGFVKGKYDAYSLSGDFPDGLDCQVFSFSSIYKSWKEAKLPSEREHVGISIERNDSKFFKTGRLIKFQNLGHHRWTLDEPEDYDFLKVVFSKLYKSNSVFKTKDIINLINKEPELARINSKILRNEGYLNSLKKEN